MEEQKDQENRVNNGVCSRQSSTRWTPTPEQIRILKELYYNRGVRSPNGEQIQSISSTLRQYGKIEGKNVFYWFQNHKARERQKKRFTSDHNNIPSNSCSYNNINKTPYNTTNYISTNSASSPTPAGFFPASTSSPSGLPTYAAYGSLTVDKTFRDQGYSNNNIGVQHNYGSGGGWAEAYNNNNSNTTSCYSFFDMQKSVNETLQEKQDEEEEEDVDIDDEKKEEMMIETLPLFPTQREEFIINSTNNNSCYSYTNSSSWYATNSDDIDYNAARTSIELTLNSYTSHGPHYS